MVATGSFELPPYFVKKSRNPIFMVCYSSSMFLLLRGRSFQFFRCDFVIQEMMMFEQRAEKAGNISCIIYKPRTLFQDDRPENDECIFHAFYLFIRINFLKQNAGSS